MIHSKTQPDRHAPVYREITKQALHTAWHDWRYWILSFFASFLLTAGVYDYALKMLAKLAEFQGLSWTQPRGLFSGLWSGFGSLTGIFATLETVALGTLIILAILGFSCIAQGALVYVLGAQKFKEKPDLRKALYVGAQNFWPIVTLSLLADLSFLFLSALFFAAAAVTSAWPVVFYPVVITLGLIETAAALAIGIIQVYALNAMVLQGAKLTDALNRAQQLLKKHWLVSLETASLLLVMAVAVEVVYVWVAFLVSALFKVVSFSAWVWQSQTMYLLSVAGWLTLMGAARFLAIAFKTQMQFATWTFLYRRLGEGGVLPKLHRLVRTAIGSFRAPNP